jgi:hypothetical protein
MVPAAASPRAPLLRHHCVMLNLTWKVRGLPTDAPLKNAPFNKYFLLRMLST